MDNFAPNTLMRNAIRRTYYKSNLYTLQIYIPPVETIYSPSAYQVGSNGILYFSLPWSKNGGEFKQQTTRSFAIRQNNIRRVLRVFDRALRWFEDERFSDLYFVNDGHLIFNTKYNDICEKYIPRYMETQALKIAPICIEYANGKYQEGVRIYVNRLENYIELSVDDLRELFDLLMGFNFPEEITQTYLALWHSLFTKSIMDQETYRTRMLNPN